MTILNYDSLTENESKTICIKDNVVIVTIDVEAEQIFLCGQVTHENIMNAKEELMTMLFKFKEFFQLKSLI